MKTIFRLAGVGLYASVTLLLMLDDSFFLGLRSWPWTNVLGGVLALVGVHLLNSKEKEGRA